MDADNNSQTLPSRAYRLRGEVHLLPNSGNFERELIEVQTTTHRNENDIIPLEDTLGPVCRAERAMLHYGTELDELARIRKRLRLEKVRGAHNITTSRKPSP